MDFTQRMLRLLGEVRRERNGEAAASTRFCGAACGLDYGVSLPDVRALARAEQADHAFAKYLYQQDVRELRLAALHLAEPACVTEPEFSFWAVGIVNSELAEEAAFALLCKIECLPALFVCWTASENPLLRYAVLLAAARSAELDVRLIDPAMALLRRYPDDLLTARGVVALLAALALNEEHRPAVARAADVLGASPSEDFVHEEIAWRLEA